MSKTDRDILYSEIFDETDRCRLGLTNSLNLRLSWSSNWRIWLMCWLKRVPTQSPYHFNLRVVLNRQDQVPSAIEVYRQAVTAELAKIANDK